LHKINIGLDPNLEPLQARDDGFAVAKFAVESE